VPNAHKLQGTSPNFGSSRQSGLLSTLLMSYAASWRPLSPQIGCSYRRMSACHGRRWQQHPKRRGHASHTLMQSMNSTHIQTVTGLAGSVGDMYVDTSGQLGFCKFDIPNSSSYGSTEVEYRGDSGESCVKLSGLIESTKTRRLHSCTCEYIQYSSYRHYCTTRIEAAIKSS
jgi:hypothetical protein